MEDLITIYIDVPHGNPIATHTEYDYNSNRKIGIQPHWHVFCGENVESATTSGYEFLLPIWDAVQHKYKLEDVRSSPKISWGI